MSREPLHAGEARQRNVAAWVRAKRQPGTLHVGDRMRSRSSSWKLRHDERAGYAWTGYCSCQRSFIKSRVYWSMQYAITGPLFGPLVVGARTRQAKRFHARKCTACRDKASAARLARGTNVARQRRRAEARAGRTCVGCGAALDSARVTRRYCSVKCRVTAWRRNGNGRPVSSRRFIR